MTFFTNMHSDEEIATRFRTSVRVIRDRAKKKGFGRKLARKLWLTEDEILDLMDKKICPSSSSNGRDRHIGTSGENISANPFMLLQKRETKQMLADLRQTSNSKLHNQPGGNVALLHSKKPPHSI